MISKKFLKGTRVAGLEFMDFQSDVFYRELSSHFEQYISSEGVLSKEFEDGAKLIIRKHTGFTNLTFQYENSGNLGVDVGYFSPKHVFNSELVDSLLPTTETTLYKWFVQNKEKVFNGTVEYDTGKVTGAFQNIPVNFMINPSLNDTFPKEKVEKFKIPLHGVLAGAFAHELGHIFSGCMMLMTTASDNMLLKASLRIYQNSKTSSERAVVMRDITTILDIPPVKQDELRALSEKESDVTFFLYFNKMISQRNSRRSLSVGVETMSSEVVADMYAIRMGCDKGVIAAISILVDQGCIRIVLDSMLQACLLTALVYLGGLIQLAFVANLAVNLIVLGTLFAVFFIASYFARGYSGIYNADHRRLDDGIRQLIMKVKEGKNIPQAVRATLVQEITDLLELNKKLKPWYDNTIVYRAFGWLFNGGSDFKKVEVEHYTSVLANHEVNLLSDQLRATGKYTIAEKLDRLNAHRNGTLNEEPETKTFEA